MTERYKFQTLGVTDNRPTELAILEDALELQELLEAVAGGSADVPQTVFSRDSLSERFRLGTFRDLARQVDTGGVAWHDEVPMEGKEWDLMRVTVLTGRVYDSHLVRRKGFPPEVVRARYDGPLLGWGETVGITVEEGFRFKAASLALGQQDHELALWTAAGPEGPRAVNRSSRVQFNQEGRRVMSREPMRTGISRPGLAPRR